jgi:hypothetical protein
VPAPPAGALIVDPSGAPAPDPIGWVEEPDGVGAPADEPPHAVGWSVGVSDALEPGPFELGSDVPLDPDVPISGCAPLAGSFVAAFAEGGGTVRSLWQ